MITKNKKSEKYLDKSVEAIDAGLHNKAKKWLRLAQFHGLNQVQFHFQRGKIALEELKLDQALKHFHSYLSLSLQLDYTVYYYLGECYFAQGNSDESIKYFQLALNESESPLIQIKSLYYLDRLKVMSDDKVQKIVDEKFNYSLEIQQHSCESKRINALSYSLKGYHDEAIDLMNQVITEEPKHREAYKELFECYLRAKLYDDIIKKYNSKKSFFKKDKAIKLLLAKVYYSSNHFLEAKQLLHELLEEVPGNAKLYFNLANVYYKLNQHGKAGKYYSKAIELNEKFDLARYNLGVLYHKSGLLDMSKECYDDTIEINPSFSQAWYNLGILHYQKKDYFESIQSFIEIEKRNIKHKKAKHNLSTVKKIKVIDPVTPNEQRLLSRLNFYLFAIAIILLVVFLYFKS